MNTDAEQLRSKLERFRGFLQQDADNVSLAGEVADLHFRLGEFDQARTVLEQALGRSPSHPTLLSSLASVAMATNDPELAIRLLQGLLEAGHSDPIVRYNLAYAYLYARQPDKAKEQLNLIEGEGEKLPRLRLLLAQTQHFLGDLDGAIDNVRGHLDRQPDDAEALGVLALLKLDSMDPEDAKVAAEKALALSQDNLNALVTLGSLALNVQDATEADRYFEKALNRHPTSGRAWSGKGLTDMLRLDLDKALADLKLAVKYMPEHIGTWHALAWCQLLKNDLAGAEESFNCSMKIDRTFSETHGGLAVVHIAQNRIALAEPEIKRALRLDPNCFSGRFAQSLLIGKTSPEKAQKMIQDILASSPIPGGESLQESLQRMMRQRPSPKFPRPRH